MIVDLLVRMDVQVPISSDVRKLNFTNLKYILCLQVLILLQLSRYVNNSMSPSTPPRKGADEGFAFTQPHISSTAIANNHFYNNCISGTA